MLRSKNFPEVQQRLWGGHLWSPSYFAVSCGAMRVETTAHALHGRAVVRRGIL